MDDFAALRRVQRCRLVVEKKKEKVVKRSERSPRPSRHGVQGPA